jgi:hypothetical protein
MLFTRTLMAAAAAALLSTGSALVASAPAKAQGVPCANDIVPLRNAVDKEGHALKAAIDRKAERSEVCGLVRRYAAAEAKFVKYLETNQSWCGVPAEAMTQVKANHSKTLKMRSQACAAATGPSGPPPGPGLSDALGTSRTFTPPPGRTDRGTYNTLTGNPLHR